MSLCPTKDIHSIYLDNELPLSYVKEYETHIQSCEKCRAELESLKKLRTMMIQDNEEIKFTKKDLNESYARLQMKMNFKKHTKPLPSSTWAEAIKYSIPAIAAAAVFALILPFGLKSNKQEPVQQVAAISSPLMQTSAVSLNGNNVILSATPVGTQNKKSKKNMIQDVDVFRPNFDNENTISIKITVPGLDTNPYTTEIELPVDMYKGHFE